MYALQSVYQVVVRAPARVLRAMVQEALRDPSVTRSGQAIALCPGTQLVLVTNGDPDHRHPDVASADPSLLGVPWTLRKAHRHPVRLPAAARWGGPDGGSAELGRLELLVLEDGGLWAAFWPSGGATVYDVSVKSAPDGRLWTPADGHGLASPAPELPRTSGLLGVGPDLAWRDLHVAIIGCGRSGSLMADGLAAQGIRKVTLIDGDVLEAGNLDGMALVGAAAVGRPKVESVGRALVRRFPDLAVTTLRAEFPAAEAIRMVAAAEVLVTTTDADEPRLAAGLLARSLLQIHVDIGTSTDRWSRTSGADIRVCLPSDQCLLCLGGVASAGRTREPRRPGTSSRLINAAATHVAIEMLAGVLAGGRDRSRWVRLESGGSGGILASREMQPESSADGTCPWCGVKAG